MVGGVLCRQIGVRYLRHLACREGKNVSGKVTIAEATAADIPEVVELAFHLDAHVSGAPRDSLKMTPQGMAELEGRFRSFIENPYKLLMVARHVRAGVIGMGNIALWLQAEVWETPERQGQWYGVADDVWVEPVHRRQGINRRMIEQLLAFARDRGVESRQLEYSASNKDAARVWARLGSRPVGIRAAATVTIEEVADAAEFHLSAFTDD